MANSNLFRRMVHSGLDAGPHLVVTAGVHGDEFTPIAAVQALSRLIVDGAVHGEQLSGTLTLVPLVNESAFLQGTRCGEDGLDLARTCPGNPEGSVTEQVAHHLSLVIRTADYYVDLHTGGTEMSVFPLCGYTMHENPEVLAAQRRMAHAFDLPFVWGTSPDLHGRTLSVARDANVPAIYCEYLGSAMCHSDGVNAYVQGVLNVMRVVGILSCTSSSQSVERVVEDGTPGSGHMQVRHPSPVTGYFEPSVKLGDEVTSGDELGVVTDLVTGGAVRILADQSGKVIVLRSFPRVMVGASVGVIA